MPLPSFRNVNEQDLSAPMTPKKGLFDIGSTDAGSTVAGSTVAGTPGKTSNYMARSEAEREATAQAETDRIAASRAASRAVAKSYIFRTPKAKSTRTSGIGMRNNAATLG